MENERKSVWPSDCGVRRVLSRGRRDATRRSTEQTGRRTHLKLIDKQIVCAMFLCVCVCVYIWIAHISADL